MSTLLSNVESVKQARSRESGAVKFTVMDMLLTLVQVAGDRDKVDDPMSLLRRILFTLTLKESGWNAFGNTDAGREFHSFAVHITKDEWKHLVRIGGIATSNFKRIIQQTPDRKIG